MSVIGKRNAIVSLGSSCQTAQQIKAHAVPLSAMVRDNLTASRLPFDWVISPVPRIMDWLLSESRFPLGPAELKELAGMPGSFLWSDHGVYFWHDFRNAKREIDISGTFQDTLNKYAHAFSKLNQLSELDRVVAVISNTQNNLPVVLKEDYAGGKFTMSEANVVGVKAAFEKVIGRSCEMICVTYDDRCDPDFDDKPDHSITVFRIAKDPSAWEGDPLVWETILSQYFAE